MNRWNFESFGSGTHIVKYDNNTPHCYVYADDRWNVCIDLENWLNHGKVPSWATSLKVSEDCDECIIGDFGIKIIVVGPMVLPEDDNGRLNWQTDLSNKAKEHRKQLIRRIMEDVKSYTADEIIENIADQIQLSYNNNGWVLDCNNCPNEPCEACNDGNLMYSIFTTTEKRPISNKIVKIIRFIAGKYDVRIFDDGIICGTDDDFGYINTFVTGLTQVASDKIVNLRSYMKGWISKKNSIDDQLLGIAVDRIKTIVNTLYAYDDIYVKTNGCGCMQLPFKYTSIIGGITFIVTINTNGFVESVEVPQYDGLIFYKDKIEYQGDGVCIGGRYYSHIVKTDIIKSRLDVLFKACPKHVNTEIIDFINNSIDNYKNINETCSSDVSVLSDDIILSILDGRYIILSTKLPKELNGAFRSAKLYDVSIMNKHIEMMLNNAVTGNANGIYVRLIPSSGSAGSDMYYVYKSRTLVHGSLVKKYMIIEDMKKIKGCEE